MASAFTELINKTKTKMSLTGPARAGDEAGAAQSMEVADLDGAKISVAARKAVAPRWREISSRIEEPMSIVLQTMASAGIARDIAKTFIRQYGPTVCLLIVAMSGAQAPSSDGRIGSVISRWASITDGVTPDHETVCRAFIRGLGQHYSGGVQNRAGVDVRVEHSPFKAILAYLYYVKRVNLDGFETKTMKYARSKFGVDIKSHWWMEAAKLYSDPEFLDRDARRLVQYFQLLMLSETNKAAKTSNEANNRTLRRKEIELLLEKFAHLTTADARLAFAHERANLMLQNMDEIPTA